jgi:hypothetical protein
MNTLCDVENPHSLARLQHLRGKGYFVHAKHPNMAWSWSHAGQIATARRVGQWQQTPRQELVFIGQNLYRTRIEILLHQALATPEEIKHPRSLKDFFPKPPTFWAMLFSRLLKAFRPNRG